ncbi:MAG: kinase/pyrophosphorylase [Candidatus Fermentithermobacillus carboniphilus]|uniref:Putative pyruvate, phosphate dikinase regulatory protein n=1 Tax=Candidatus Fermentithermobacillus carboniphilus TaxID=3085328 RepID=A0AAT9LFG3_9FIRM|nr:MAG: kinase/pyrophosphorylase [Candidatus Fermentithermobacillus carboniphilus]
MDREKPVVLVLSDSLGETAELVARAAAAQFNAGGVDIKKFGYVQTYEAVDSAIAEGVGKRSIVVYTLVKPELRDYVRTRAEELGIPAVDIMGPMMEALSRVTESKPKFEPGLVHRLDAQYFKRVEAIEFAVKCDDGKDLRSLPFADVVLLGVSRTSKTPVSLYLAQRTYKVANVPLVPELPPPPEIFKISPDKIVGLTLSPEKLVKVRRERLRAMGLDENSTYADMGRILLELEFAEKVFREIGCSILDVTDKAVEETALRVVEIIERRSPRSGN